MEIYNTIYKIAIPFWDMVSDFLNLLKNTTVPFVNAWGPIWTWEFDIVSLLEVTLTTGLTYVLVYRIVRVLTV